MEINQVAFFTESSEITAVEHLRIYGPLQYAGVKVINGIINGNLNLDIIEGSQAFIFQRDFPKRIDLYQAILKEAERINIPIILDMDDNLLLLPEEHPDRISGYYIKNLVPLIHALHRVDAIFVTNQNLANHFSTYSKAIYILPNYLDDGIWKPGEIDRTNDDPLKLLYMGTSTHKPDLLSLTRVFRKLSTKYPDIQLISVGIEPPDEVSQVITTKYIPKLSDNYTEFAQKLPLINGNIAIAPLVANEFNRGKSPLKYFEYSAVSLPAVYSNIEPYSEVVQHGKTGFLATTDEEWLNYIERMIVDKDLRRKIAHEAKQDVIKNWSMKDYAQKWTVALSNVVKSSKQANKEHPSFLPDLINVSKQVLEWSDLRDNEALHMLSDIKTLQNDLERVFSEKEALAIELKDLTEKKEHDIACLQEDLKKVLSEKEALEIELKDLTEKHTLLTISEQQLRSDLIMVKKKLDWTEYRLNAVETSRTWRLATKAGVIKNKILNPFRRTKLIHTKDNIEEQVLPGSKSLLAPDQSIVLETGLFDEAWYLINYPDVLETNMNPLDHFLKFGGFEGRNPGPLFDSKYYIAENEDVLASGMNPLVHYALIGKKEGRSIMPKIEQDTGVKPVSRIKKAATIVRNEGFGTLINKGMERVKAKREFFEEMEKVENPNFFDASLVIPVYNASTFTVECIQRLYEVENNINFEVILVDNNSTDETESLMKKELARRANFTYCRMEENLGFSGGVNAGINLSKGKYVVILNNDTKVTDGWLDRLVEVVERNPEIGIVSPVTNYVGEGAQIDPEAVEIDVDRIDTYAELIKHREMIFEPRRLVFFCVLIKKTVIDHIGLLDEGYIKGNFEDDDYCTRTIMSGYHLAIARNSFVYHHGSVTFNKNQISHISHMEKNRKRFYRKIQNLSVSPRIPFRTDDEIMMSIVVRTLNRPKLLTRALTSLSNQTCKKFEVILINDGGEDVQDIVTQFSKFYSINYVHHKQSKGRTQALNAGIKSSSTSWLNFLDDDDIIYPWHVDVLLHHQSNKPNLKFLYTDYNRSIFNNTLEDFPIVTKGTEPWEYNSEEMWVTNRIPIHTWLISKSCFDAVGLFDETLMMLEDFEFLVRLNQVTDFYHINAVTCEYRFYLDGMNSMINQREKTLDALKYIYNQHPSNDLHIKQKREMELASLHSQIEKISKLKELIKKYPEKERMIYRQIAALILGF